MENGGKIQSFLPSVCISFERSPNSATVLAGGDARVLYGPSSSHKFTSISASITIADCLACGGDIQDGKDVLARDAM